VCATINTHARHRPGGWRGPSRIPAGNTIRQRARASGRNAGVAARRWARIFRNGSTQAPPERCACPCILLHLSNSPAGKPDRSGKSSAPGRRSVLSASKSSRRVKRRKALVRNAAPVAALRLGQSLHRKGLPAHDAGRRALRRFTTAFHEALPHLLSGRAFLPGLLTRSPGSPAGSLRTGHLVPVGRGPRPPGSPADEAGRAGTPYPAPPIDVTG